MDFEWENYITNASKTTTPTIESVALEVFVFDPFFTVAEEVRSITNQGQHFGGPQHPATVTANAATGVIVCALS